MSEEAVKEDIVEEEIADAEAAKAEAKAREQEEESRKEESAAGHDDLDNFEFQHKRLARLYDYWKGLKGDKPLPQKKAFDPVEVPRLLKYIMMVDTHLGRRHYNVRVMGTEIVEQLDNDYTGGSLIDIDLGESRFEFSDLLREVVSAKRPMVDHFEFFNRDGYRIRFQSLMLPFGDDQDKVQCVVIGFTFGDPERVDE